MVFREVWSARSSNALNRRASDWWLWSSCRFVSSNYSFTWIINVLCCLHSPDIIARCVNVWWLCMWCDLYVRPLKTCWNSITLILKTGRFTLDLSSTWTLGLLLRWWVLNREELSSWLSMSNIQTRTQYRQCFYSGTCLFKVSSECTILNYVLWDIVCYRKEAGVCVQAIHMPGPYSLLCMCENGLVVNGNVCCV